MAARLFRSIGAAALLASVAMSAGAQSLTRAKLESWLASYGNAWETRDADLATRVFAPDATYHEMPFDAPKSGRAAIREYWSSVTADQRDVQFDADVIAVNGNTGVAHWHAKFKLASNGATVELDGVFVLEFDANGLCTSLREWWHAKP
jgi:ketosteroid isomerase-like protein